MHHNEPLDITNWIIGYANHTEGTTDMPRISGYHYLADSYCPNCVLDAMGIATEDHRDTELTLDRYAPTVGIADRYDESTFDSDVFPKVIFAWDGWNDRCSVCHETI